MELYQWIILEILVIYKYTVQMPFHAFASSVKLNQTTLREAVWSVSGLIFFSWKRFLTAMEKNHFKILWDIVKSINKYSKMKESIKKVKQ